MPRSKFPTHPFKGPTLIRCLSSLLLATILFSPQGLAQSSRDLRFNTRADDFEGEGRPPSRTSAGSRSPCLEQFIALVPGMETVDLEEGDCSAKSRSLMALTLTDTPTFWFYVPEQSHSDVTAELVLLDEFQRPLVTQEVTLPGEAGLVGVPLDGSLEPDRTYRWIFSILDHSSRSSDAFVEGLVQRIEPDSTLDTQLAAAASETERLAIYADHGIWHDALTLLVELRRTHPDQAAVTRDWSSFLESVGLEAIANAPILNCCRIPEESETTD